MRIIGCDLHASQQTIAMLDCETGGVVERTLKHDAETVREFYGALPRPVVVGIEATGSMGWFLRLMEELGITCHVGHPARIRSAETTRQKHDRRDVALLLTLLTQNRFPSIWMPSTELCDLRALLRHRHQWVRIRTRVMNALQGLALAHGIRRGAAWRAGRLYRKHGISSIDRVDRVVHREMHVGELDDDGRRRPCSVDEREVICDCAPVRDGVRFCDRRHRRQSKVQALAVVAGPDGGQGRAVWLPSCFFPLLPDAGNRGRNWHRAAPVDVAQGGAWRKMTAIRRPRGCDSIEWSVA